MLHALRLAESAGVKHLIRCPSVGNASLAAVWRANELANHGACRSYCPNRAAAACGKTRSYVTLFNKQDAAGPSQDPRWLPPSEGGPAAVMDDAAWQTRTRQKISYVRPALDAAERGEPPPLTRPSPADPTAPEALPELGNAESVMESLGAIKTLPSTPDPALFRFVRVRLLRIAEAELQEERWVRGARRSDDLIPASSRITSHCFMKAIESFAHRGDFFAVATLLEDWFNFFPKLRFGASRRIFAKKFRLRTKRVTSECVRALCGYGGSLPCGDPAVMACADKIKSLFYASANVRLMWPRTTLHRSLSLVTRARDLSTGISILERCLMDHWWRIKLAKPTGTPEDPQALAHRRGQLSNATKTVLHMTSRLVQNLVMERKRLINSKQTLHAGPDADRMQDYFSQLSALSSLYSRNIFMPFGPTQKSDGFVDPFLLVLAELCKARDTAMNLGLIPWEEDPSAKEAQSGHTSPIYEQLDSIEQDMQTLVESTFLHRPQGGASTMKRGDETKTQQQRRRALYRTSLPSYQVCTTLLRFSLRALVSPTLAAAITRHTIGIAEQEAAKQRRTRKYGAAEGAARSRSQGAVDSVSFEDERDTKGADSGDTGVAKPDENSHLSSHEQDVRASHTTLLNEACRLRQPVLEEAALKLIICEDLGKEWLDDSHARHGLTSRHYEALLEKSLAEGDFHRVCVVLRFLVANGLVRTFPAKRSHDEAASQQAGSAQASRGPRRLSRHVDPKLGPIAGPKLFAICFPTLAAESLARHRGGVGIQGKQHFESLTSREVATLANAHVCGQLLSCLVKSGSWQVVEDLWRGIVSFCTALPVGNGGSHEGRFVTVAEATAMIQFYGGVIKVMLPLTHHHWLPRRDLETSSRPTRTHDQSLEDVLSVHSRVGAEYDTMMGHWRPLYRAFDPSDASLDHQTAFCRPDKRFFKTTLDALAWPRVIGALARQRGSSAETDANHSQVRYFDQNAQSSTQTQHHSSEEHDRVCLSVLDNRDATDLLLRILQDMHHHGIPIPSAYITDILPLLGWDADDLRRASNQRHAQGVLPSMKMPDVSPWSAHPRSKGTRASDEWTAGHRDYEHSRTQIQVDKDRGLYRRRRTQRKIDISEEAQREL